MFTIKVNECFIAHDSSQQIRLLLSFPSGRRPQEASPQSQRTSSAEHFVGMKFGADIVHTGIFSEMCKGSLEVER